jgi:hypothetical protein
MADEKDFMEALTDEERAEINAAGADEIEDDSGEETKSAEAEAEATAAAESSEDASAQGETDQQNNDDIADPILPPLRAKAPENVEEIISAINAEEDALAQKFDDGDITAREYRDGLNKLSNQRDEIRWDQRKADLAREMEDTAKANAWQREVQDFMTTTAANITKSHAQMVAFDDIVKKVTADPANLNLSDRAQLEKAYKIYMDDVGAALGVQSTPPKAAQQTTQRAVRNVPPTLARVPAAEPERLDGGKYAALDRLAADDPIAYEAAVAKMSESERSQYESVM